MKAKKIVTLLVAAALTCGVVGSTTSVYAADVTLKLAHADAEGSIFDQGAVAFQENYRNFPVEQWTLNFIVMVHLVLFQRLRKDSDGNR